MDIRLMLDAARTAKALSKLLLDENQQALMFYRKDTVLKPSKEKKTLVEEYKKPKLTMKDLFDTFQNDRTNSSQRNNSQRRYDTQYVPTDIDQNDTIIHIPNSNQLPPKRTGARNRGEFGLQRKMTEKLFEDIM
jgi:hypothetical protein